MTKENIVEVRYIVLDDTASNYYEFSAFTPVEFSTCYDARRILEEDC